MKITKDRTKAIVNQADQAVTHIEITDINEGDQTIFCNLYVDDVLLTTGRVYPFDKFPCETLNTGEKELIKNKDPNDKWNVPEIKTWLDAKQERDEDGKAKEDKYIYSDKALKDDLLAIVTTVKAKQLEVA